MSELNINAGVEIRDAELELHHFRMRLGIASTFVLVMFGLLFARFFYLQVVMHDHYHTLAEANRISILPIVPNRGIIVDRNGVVLATNYSAYTLELTPSKIDNLENTIGELATLVEITPRESSSRKANVSKACRSARASQTKKSRASPPIATASPESTSVHGSSVRIRRGSSSHT
jgi:cell division protein FtsI/penicillin-binding protein 2